MNRENRRETATAKKGRPANAGDAHTGAERPARSEGMKADCGCGATMQAQTPSHCPPQQMQEKEGK